MASASKHSSKTKKSISVDGPTISETATARISGRKTATSTKASGKTGFDRGMEDSTSKMAEYLMGFTRTIRSTELLLL